MDCVGNVLKSALQSSGIKNKFMIYHCLLHWEEIVGPDISLHTSPGIVQGGTLFVNVDHSVWCHHLTMMKEDIINKVNNFAIRSFATEKIIRNIRFQAGDLKNNKNGNNLGEEEENQSKPILMVSRQEMQAASQMASLLKNKHLQNKLAKLIGIDLALKKHRQMEQWHVCQNCKSLCPPEEMYCNSCKITKKQEKELSIRKLLLNIPWITYEECNQYEICAKQEFKKAKEKLIEKLARIMYAGNQDVMQTATLIMLVNSCRPDDITEEMEQYIIKKYSRRKKSVFTSRS